MSLGTAKAAAVVSVMLLGGCIGAAQSPFERGAPLAAGEVVLIGQIDLEPPLRPDEQAFSGANRAYQGKIVLLTSRRPQPVGDIGVSDMRRRIEVPLQKPFFVRTDNEPFYIVGAVVLMKGRISSHLGHARLPALYRVDIRPEDRAVYLGTLRYHRDEFFGVTGIDIRDDMEREPLKTEMQKYLGRDYPVRRALFKKWADRG